MSEELDPLARLRAPFPPNAISKLPKPLRKDAPKGRCDECGGYHGLPAIHLDYVGHAALTDRLLDVDPRWTWEPVGFGPDGLPAMDAAGGMWIRLTVAGVTRLGYGSADGKRGGDAIKEIIGDALRNAAMRFGAALDLWHKGDLHAIIDQSEDSQRQQERQPREDRQQQGRRDNAPTAADWANKQIAAFERFTAPADDDELQRRRNDPRYTEPMGRLANDDNALWQKVKDAEAKAIDRCDDVPF